MKNICEVIVPTLTILSIAVYVVYKYKHIDKKDNYCNLWYLDCDACKSRNRCNKMRKLLCW